MLISQNKWLLFWCCIQLQASKEHISHISSNIQVLKWWLTLHLLIESLSIICWVMNLSHELWLHYEALLQGYCQKCIELHMQMALTLNLFHLKSHILNFGTGRRKNGGWRWGHYFLGNLHVSLREQTVCVRCVLSSMMNIHLQNKHQETTLQIFLYKRSSISSAM